MEQAQQQLKIENMLGDAPLQPGGKYDGQPADYALSRFMYFRCYACKQPYYGGQRQCGAGGAQQQGKLAWTCFGACRPRYALLIILHLVRRASFSLMLC